MKQRFAALALVALVASIGWGADSAAAPTQKSGRLIKLYDNRHGIPVYFIKDSLVKEAAFIQIDSLSDHEPSDTSGAKSSTSLMRFKCGKKEVSVVDIVLYPDSGGRGRAMERLLNPDTSFKPVQRGSEKEYMLTVACAL